MVHQQPKQLNPPPSGHTKEDLACMKVSSQEYITESTAIVLQLPRRESMLQSQPKQPEKLGQSQEKHNHRAQS